MGVPVNLSCCSIEMKSRVSKVVLSSASVKLSLFFGCCVLQLSCVCLFVVFIALLCFVQLVLDMIVVCSIVYLFLLFSTCLLHLFVCSSLSCLRVTAVTLLRWLSEKSKKVDQYWCML